MKKRIKWESVALVNMFTLSFVSILTHIVTNGIDNLILELNVYSLLTFGVWYGVKSLRKNIM